MPSMSNQLKKLKEALAPAIGDAERGVYAEYSYEQLMHELDRK